MSAPTIDIPETLGRTFVEHWREPGALFVAGIIVFSTWRLLGPVSQHSSIALVALLATTIVTGFLVVRRLSDLERRAALSRAWHGSLVALWASHLLAAYIVVPFGGVGPFMLSVAALPFLVLLGPFQKLQGIVGIVIALAIFPAVLTLYDAVPHGPVLAEVAVRVADGGLTNAVEVGQADAEREGVSYFMWNGYMIDGATGLAHDPSRSLDDPEVADSIWHAFTGDPTTCTHLYDSWYFCV